MIDNLRGNAVLKTPTDANKTHRTDNRDLSLRKKDLKGVEVEIQVNERETKDKCLQEILESRQDRVSKIVVADMEEEAEEDPITMIEDMIVSVQEISHGEEVAEITSKIDVNSKIGETSEIVMILGVAEEISEEVETNHLIEEEVETNHSIEEEVIRIEETSKTAEIFTIREITMKKEIIKINATIRIDVIIKIKGNTRIEDSMMIRETSKIEIEGTMIIVVLVIIMMDPITNSREMVRGDSQ